MKNTLIEQWRQVCESNLKVNEAPVLKMQWTESSWHSVQGKEKTQYEVVGAVHGREEL